MQVWSDGMCIAQTDLFAMNNVALRAGEEDGVQDRENQSQVVWIVILIFVILALLGFIIHKYRYLIQRFLKLPRKHKRRIRRRRR